MTGQTVFPTKLAKPICQGPGETTVIHGVGMLLERTWEEMTWLLIRRWR